MSDRKEVSVFKYVGWVTSLGIMMIACIIVGLIAGKYIDKQFNTSPWMALTFMIIGMIAGGWSIYKSIMIEFKRDDNIE